MLIITEERVVEFARQHPEAASSLFRWAAVTRMATWKNIVEVRQVFRHADPVGSCVVFNIMGIEAGAELERLAKKIEPLLAKGDRRSPEEEELCRLGLKLIDAYQRERHLIPKLKPHELLQALLDESGKQQADLVPVFGSRSRVSDAVNGKREISKAQAKRLSQLFHLSPAAFI